MTDVDHAATDFPELNFIVEHSGIPRIDDFCYMATQEPNVYAGLSVVIGALMHARPRFFARCMGELLFWVGEDKMTFGSDYSIWEPKWQVEGFVDWDYPSDEFSDYPRVTTATKKKILGLNAAKLYDIEVPVEFQLPAEAGTPAAQDAASWGRRRRRGQGVTHEREVLDALGTVRDPELDEPVTSLGFVTSCTVSADGVADVRLRLPTYFCAPNFAWLMVADAYDAVSAVPGVRQTQIELEDHFASAEINRGVAARAGFVQSFDGLAETELDELRTDFVRKAMLAATDRVCRPLLAAGRTPDELAVLTLGDVPQSPDRERLRARRAELGLPAGDDAPLLVDPLRGEAVGVQALPLHLRRARLTGIGLEANGGVCRGMLRERYATIGVGEEEEPMKAVRLHEYNQMPVIEEVPEPSIKSPLDVIVKIGGAGRLPNRPAHHPGTVGGGDEPVAARTPSATRTPAGCTRSAPRSRTSQSATRSSCIRRRPAACAAPVGRARTCIARTVSSRASTATAGWPSTC